MRLILSRLQQDHVALYGDLKFLSVALEKCKDRMKISPNTKHYIRTVSTVMLTALTRNIVGEYII